MKNIIIIALFFVVSCQSDDKTIEYLNEGVNLGIDYLKEMNSETHAKFEAAMQENPQQVKKHKDIVDKISIQSIFLQKEIDTLINNLSLKIKDHSRIEGFRKNLRIYQESIDSIAKDDSLLYKLTNQIGFQFEDAETNQLLILKNKVSLLEKYVLDRQYKNLSFQNSRFNKRKVAICPEKFELKKNEHYKADLILLEYYTDFKFNALIDGKMFSSKNGTICYKDTNTIFSGTVNKKGILMWQYPKTKKKVEVPFNLNYKILNQ